MPQASKQTASRIEDIGILETRAEDLGDGWLVEFSTYREDADATPFFRGLPDDRCQSPHWGYVLKGRLRFAFADRTEIYAAGDASYAPPGHVPMVDAGTEVVEFSPVDAAGRTREAVARNAAELLGARS